MVACFCNTNGFGTFLALFILAITFRVLKITQKLLGFENKTVLATI
jgi:hypothetical protein